MVSSGFAFVCWAQVEPLMSHCNCFLRVSIDGSSEESALKPHEKLGTLGLLCCTWLESNNRSYWNGALGFSGFVGLWRSGEGKRGHTGTGRNGMCFVWMCPCVLLRHQVRDPVLVIGRSDVGPAAPSDHADHICRCTVQKDDAWNLPQKISYGDMIKYGN